MRSLDKTSLLRTQEEKGTGSVWLLTADISESPQGPQQEEEGPEVPHGRSRRVSSRQEAGQTPRAGREEALLTTAGHCSQRGSFLSLINLSTPGSTLLNQQREGKQSVAEGKGRPKNRGRAEWPSFLQAGGKGRGRARRDGVRNLEASHILSPCLKSTPLDLPTSV